MVSTHRMGRGGVPSGDLPAVLQGASRGPSLAISLQGPLQGDRQLEAWLMRNVPPPPPHRPRAMPLMGLSRDYLGEVMDQT